MRNNLAFEKRKMLKSQKNMRFTQYFQNLLSDSNVGEN